MTILFEYTQDIELIDNNVAYTNETCRKVSQHIRKERGITKNMSQAIYLFVVFVRDTGCQNLMLVLSSKERKLIKTQSHLKMWLQDYNKKKTKELETKFCLCFMLHMP